MAVKFDNFELVATKKQLINRWKFYHTCAAYYNTLQEGSLERLISGACLDDDYDVEMKGDQLIMGVGLNAYQQDLRLHGVQ